MRILFIALIYVATTYAVPLGSLIGDLTKSLGTGSGSSDLLNDMLGRDKSSRKNIPSENDDAPVDKNVARPPKKETPSHNNAKSGAVTTPDSDVDDVKIGKKPSATDETKALPAKDGTPAEVADIFENMKKLLPTDGSVGAALDPLAKLITAPFALVLILLTEFIPKLLPTFDPIIKRLLPIVTPLVTSLVPYISPLIKQIAPKIVPLVKPILSSILPPFTQFLRIIIQIAPDIVPSLMQALLGLPDTGDIPIPS